MNADFQDRFGKLVQRTSGLSGESRTLFRWFPKVPLAVEYEGKTYIDTGTYEYGFRVYREGHRTVQFVAHD